MQHLTKLKDIIRAYVLAHSGERITTAQILKDLGEHDIRPHQNTVLMQLKEMARDRLVERVGRLGSRYVKWKVATIREDERLRIQAALENTYVEKEKVNDLFQQ